MPLIRLISYVVFSVPLLLQSPPSVLAQDATPTLRPHDSARAPLLREGTFLNRVSGTAHFASELGVWQFRTAPRGTGGFSRELTLLPSRVLEDLLALDEARFELTGRVLVYHGMNFLLPTMASPLRDVAESEPEPAPEPEQPSQAPKNSLDDESNLAQSIETRLAQRLTTIPSSVVTERAPQTTTIREGTRLQNRRGVFTRDQQTGVWRFLFAAESPAQLDPAMELLPCEALSEIESLAMRSRLPETVVLSGKVTSFRGRNYLLLTAWRAAERSQNIRR